MISGAYFGDTTSPLSDSANLAAAAAGVDLYEHIRETALTSGLALAIALVVFWLLGQPGDFDASDKMRPSRVTFHLSLVMFLPLVVVVALAVFKVPAVHHDLPRRARRRRARRVRGTGPRDRLRRHR